MVEQNRGWLEGIAEQITGRKLAVRSVLNEAAAGRTESAPGVDRKTALKAEALADEGVKAVLEVFPAEIRDVEEM